MAFLFKSTELCIRCCFHISSAGKFAWSLGVLQWWDRIVVETFASVLFLYYVDYIAKGEVRKTNRYIKHYPVSLASFKNRWKIHMPRSTFLYSVWLETDVLCSFWLKGDCFFLIMSWQWYWILTGALTETPWIESDFFFNRRLYFFTLTYICSEYFLGLTLWLAGRYMEQGSQYLREEA